MVTHGNQTYCGYHFVMYRNIKSLCYVPGTNTVLFLKKQTKKQTLRKRDKICGYWKWGGGGGEIG